MDRKLNIFKPEITRNLLESNKKWLSEEHSEQTEIQELITDNEIPETEEDQRVNEQPEITVKVEQ